MLSESQLKFDREHIWHPYTSLTNPQRVYPIVATNGVKLQLENGRELIDGMSSWWCAIHGYNNAHLIEAIKRQADIMPHVMFGGITHEPAIQLGQRLVELLPDGLDKVFLCDSGSISVEVSIKMALQYWHSKGQHNKKKIATIRKGYHGDTFAAMSVCDPIGGMHHLFAGVLPKQIFVDEPRSNFGEELHLADAKALEEAFQKDHTDMAAFILEPIVQGAGGMRMYSAEFLKELRRLCDHYDVLLICDEIATGFGRTGELFAVNHAQIVPDIMCLGKALTGGTMTMAATICTTTVAEVVCDGEAGVFMHGPTFMANPLACSAAIASLELLDQRDWKEEVGHIERILDRELKPLVAEKNVVDVRVLGAIGVVECIGDVRVQEIQEFFVEHGVWIRPFRNLIYLMPPFIIKEHELVKLCSVIAQSIQNDAYFRT